MKKATLSAVYVESRMNLGGANKRTDFGAINGPASETRSILTAWKYADTDKGAEEMRLGDAIAAKRILEDTLGEDHAEEILKLEAERKALSVKFAEDLNKGYALVTDDLYEAYCAGADSVEFGTTRADVLYNAVAKWLKELGFDPKHRTVEALVLAMGVKVATTQQKASAEARGLDKKYTGSAGKKSFKRTMIAALVDEMGAFLPNKKYAYIRKAIIEKVMKEAEKASKKAEK